MKQLLRRYSSSPVVGWLAVMVQMTVAVLVALTLMLGVGYVFHVPVPFILMTVCS
jgi:negative regulator of sigma E activity